MEATLKKEAKIKEKQHFSYRSLVNFKKRIENNYHLDSDAAEEFLSVVEKHIAIQKEISAEKDKTRRSNRPMEIIICAIFHRSLRGRNPYIQLISN